MQALLGNVSQRSTEKGSLKAEAGHVSILEMEIEDGGKACAPKPFPGSAVPCISVAISTQTMQKGSERFLRATRVSCHSKHESQISQVPSPGLPTRSASTRPTAQLTPAEEQEALRGTKLSICQHHLQIPQTEGTEAASNPTETKERGCQRETDNVSWLSPGPVPKAAGSVYPLSFSDPKI